MQNLAGTSIPPPDGRCRHALQAGYFYEREAFPMGKRDDFREFCWKCVHELSKGKGLCRILVVRLCDLAPECVSKRVAPSFAAVVVGQDVAGNPEHPHPGALRVER